MNATSSSSLAPARTAPIDQHHGAYYLRLMVVDQPGVIAEVSAVLRDQQVSMESMLQRGRAPGEPVPVVITTHGTREASKARARGNRTSRCSGRGAERVIVGAVSRANSGAASVRNGSIASVPAGWAKRGCAGCSSNRCCRPGRQGTFSGCYAER